MIRQLVNISSSEFELSDFNGKRVEINETFDGLSLGEQRLRDSESIMKALLERKLKLYDGNYDLYGAQAIDLIKGYAVQTTKDGKPITTSSDRPKDHYRCFTGRSDDLVTGQIGQGNDFVIMLEPGNNTGSVDAKFLDDVYIKDGEVLYENSVFDTYLSCFVLCPPNTPFPSPNRTGNLDLINGSFIVNQTGTGAYMTAPVEVKLFRFINHLHILGSNKTTVTSIEPFQVFYPYFLRFSITVPEQIERSLPVNVAINMGMYRKKTI